MVAVILCPLYLHAWQRGPLAVTGRASIERCGLLVATATSRLLCTDFNRFPELAWLILAPRKVRGHGWVLIRFVRIPIDS